MKQYHQALEHILQHGDTRGDRTGTGTIGVFGHQARYDLRKGFPAVTTKKLAWRAVVSELLWFLEGSTDERRLAEIHYGKPRDELVDKTTIWTANALAQANDLGYEVVDDYRYMGPIYGRQWREWDAGSRGRGAHTDQITSLINSLRDDPFSRRHILNAWNVGEVPNMALPPCHLLAQFYVNSNDELSCQMYQRSADMGLGVPFNIASYALLTHILARLTGLKVGEFVHSIGDAHIYLNHVEQLNEQLTREPYPAPTLRMPDFSTLEEVLALGVDDFVLDGYKHHATIKMDMAV